MIVVGVHIIYITEKPLTSKLKNKIYGWLNASLKRIETRDELSTTCNPKVMSRCLSASDAKVEFRRLTLRSVS